VLAASGVDVVVTGTVVVVTGIVAVVVVVVVGGVWICGASPIGPL
jgi:hypothetical protein